ncbi:hypothetical protein RFI_38771, partial [Reticulomyxa filosa]
MSFNTRENILTFLDQLGKFSFIDVFVTVFMIVSFYMHLIETVKLFFYTKKNLLVVSDRDFFNNNKKKIGSLGLDVQVQVEPDIGLVIFVLGTVLSQLYSHLFLYLDRKYARPHYLRHHRNRMTNPHDYHLNAQPKHIANLSTTATTATTTSEGLLRSSQKQPFLQNES